ncbi:MAG: hypothetical protein KAJ19_09670, partial [Gammaproteobacteria bacterium]|nr:hypothetical protein [Gammaproteobacteria bacterium]
MSDETRWRDGERNYVVAAVDAETVIEIGDLLWQDTDDAKPASDFRHVIKAPPGSDLPDTDLAEDAEVPYLQEMFARNFLGVAMERSRKGETAPIRVATTGVFEFDVPTDDPITCELGELFGARVIHYTLHPSSLANQEVTKVMSS